MSKISENLEEWLKIDLEDGHIGDLITFIVPEDFHHYFARFDNDVIDNQWWSYPICDSDIDSVGSNVHGLLQHFDETLAWMPDLSSEDLDKMWKIVADQCLTWVYG